MSKEIKKTPETKKKKVGKYHEKFTTNLSFEEIINLAVNTPKKKKAA